MVLVLAWYTGAVELLVCFLQPSVLFPVTHTLVYACVIIYPGGAVVQIDLRQL